MKTNNQPEVSRGEIIQISLRNEQRSDGKPLNNIWTIVSRSVDDGNLNQTIVSGYIKNHLNAQPAQPGTDEATINVSGTILDIAYLEHSNGGRSNNKLYGSIEQYINDPFVKANVARKCSAPLLDLTPGDPELVDLQVSFIIDHPDFQRQVFTLCSAVWDTIVPGNWYDEIFAGTVAEMLKLDVFPDAASALANTEQVDDLFGHRYFPVIRGPRKLADKLYDLACSCKNYSKVIGNDETIFIGLRCKPDEIFVINDVYEAGGAIVQNKQWDWS